MVNKTKMSQRTYVAPVSSVLEYYEKQVIASSSGNLSDMEDNEIFNEEL